MDQQLSAPAAPAAAHTYSSEKDTAERIGVSYPYLKARRLRGDGPPHCRLGNRVLYADHLVDRWLLEQQRKAA